MDRTTYFHTKATMSCFIDIDMFNNSYYYDFHVETEDYHLLISTNPIVYLQRGRITLFKVSTSDVPIIADNRLSLDYC